MTIKAATTDGGKKSKTWKLQISYPVVKNFCFSVNGINNNGCSLDRSKINTGTSYVRYNAPKGAVINISNSENIGTSADPRGDFRNHLYNFGYSVTGGSLTRNGNVFIIKQTARVCKFNIWDKTNKRMKSLLTITNTGFSEKLDIAPKIKPISGKLYTMPYANTTLHENGIYSSSQTYSYERGNFKTVQLGRLNSSAPYLGITLNPDKYTFTITCYSAAKAGTYKSGLTFYDANGNIAATPTTLSVKINKANPFKIASSYTIKISSGESSINLKPSPVEFIPDYSTQLLNANVKGQENAFNTYFELVYEPTVNASFINFLKICNWMYYLNFDCGQFL